MLLVLSMIRRIDESNNKRFDVHFANTDYTDVVNGTVRNRYIFTKHYSRKRGINNGKI